MSDLDNRLLRDNVNESYRIIECVIEIHPEGPKYQTATYLYKYKIKKIGNATNEWREVFAYQKKDFKVKYVTKGIEKPDNGDNGLLFNVTSLDNVAKNACLTITFDKNLEINETFSFSYECVTRIEAISNVNRFFGGNGCLWYWIANEFECDSLEIIFNLPENLTIKDTHPDNTKIEDNSIHFVSRTLARNEFVPALATYEKKFFGLSPKWGKWVQTVFNMIIGALISIGLTLLLT